MAWQAVAGAVGGSIFDKGLDLGLGAAGNAIQAKQQRKLRRTAYQDMVYSLKQAGLNPILAAQSQPLGATVGPITTGASDVMSNAVKAAKTGPEISQIKGMAALQSAQTEATRAQERLLEVEKTNKEFERIGMMKSWEKTDAEIRGINTSADLTLQDILMRPIMQKLYESQTGQHGATAEATRRGMEKIGPEIDRIIAETEKIIRDKQGNVATEFRGILRGLQELKEKTGDSSYPGIFNRQLERKNGKK